MSDIYNLPKVSSSTTDTDKLRKSTTDVEKPSTEHPTYQAIAPILEFLQDVWTGKSAWYINGRVLDLKKAQVYLPAEVDEPRVAYTSRLSRSRFDRRFREVIEDFAGLLSRYSLNSPPESFQASINNINLQGDHLDLVLQKLDQLALRDGSSLCLVDFPTENPEAPILTESDRVLAGNTPYLVIYPRAALINWRYEVTNSGLFITLAVLREIVTVDVGSFGAEERIRYRVLRPGEYELYEEVEGELTLVGSGSTNLPIIPLAIYSLGADPPFESSFPLLCLADLNLELYQLHSERRELERRLAMPVLIVNDINNYGDTDNSPITIGSNTVLRNVSPDTRFIEPTGSSLALSQKEEELILNEFNRKTLAFITGGPAQTATEANLHSSKAKANLRSLAAAKESFIVQIMQLWTLYTGEQLAEDTSAVIDQSIFETPLQWTIADLTNAVNGGLISKNLALTILQQKAGFIPEDYDIEQELALVDNQQPQAIAPPTPNEEQQEGA